MRGSYHGPNPGAIFPLDPTSTCWVARGIRSWMMSEGYREPSSYLFMLDGYLYSLAR